MSDYAIIKGGTVTNIVVADDATILPMLIPDADEIVAVTEQTGPAYIAGDVVDGRFRPAQPFPSWTWDAATWAWTPPVPYPTDENGYTWDEDAQTWVAMPAPESVPAPEE